MDISCLPFSRGKLLLLLAILFFIPLNSSQAAEQESNTFHRKIATKNLFVRFRGSATEKDIHLLEEEYRLFRVVADEKYRIYVYETEPLDQLPRIAKEIRSKNQVLVATPLWKKKVDKRNDPDDVWFSRQWHLRNTGQGNGVPGEDIHLSSDWGPLDGTSMVIGILDDGLEITHPDLDDNILEQGSYDFIEDDEDPTAGDHGTSVAGVIGAEGFNGIGVSGVAPGASLVGLRVIDGSDFVNEAAVFEAIHRSVDTVDIFNASWGPPDDGFSSFEGPSEAINSALELLVNQGRNGLGSAIVWAAGNGGARDNSNLDGYANSRYTIAVTASTNTGSSPYYAESGANILVNAPSNGGSLGITTTDRTGASGYNNGLGVSALKDPDYTDDFGGTSAATAVVSGAVGLILQANGNLSWRELIQVLALSAFQNDPDHSQWRLNAAGFPINEQYGFGRIDVANGMRLANNWSPMQKESSTPLYSRDVELEIPDNNKEGVLDTIQVEENLRIEFVELSVNIPTHSYWGDLAISLISPSGTEVRLVHSARIPDAVRSMGYRGWKMGDALHAGEWSRGPWTIRVADEMEEDIGILEGWKLKIYGSALPDTPEDLPVTEVAISADKEISNENTTIRMGTSRHGSVCKSCVEGESREDYSIFMQIDDSDGNERHPVAFARFLSPEGEPQWFVYLEDGWKTWDSSFGSIAANALIGTNGSGIIRLFHGRLPAGDYWIFGGYHSSRGWYVSRIPVRIGVESTRPFCLMSETNEIGDFLKNLN